MKPRVNRADLLQFLKQLGPQDFANVAHCFGYDAIHKPGSAVQDTKAVVELPFSKQSDNDEIEDVTVNFRPTIPRPPERFYYIDSISKSEILPSIADKDPESALPEFIRNKTIPSLDLNASTRLQIDPPKYQPLVSWARLWPVLYALLKQTQHNKNKPDYKRWVNQLAQGHQFQRMPLSHKSLWSSEIKILVDLPKRLQLFTPDYQFLIKQLKKLRGEGGLSIETLRDYPGGEVNVGAGKQSKNKAWRYPEGNVPVLIISDLGVYDETGFTQQQWQRFGRHLQSAGCQAYVLMPVPESLIPAQLTQLFHCVSWDRYSKLQTIKNGATQRSIDLHKQLRQTQLQDYLAYLSLAVEIEPALLRAVRFRLLGHQSEIALEAAVWNHEHLHSDSTTVVFQTEYQAGYQAQYIKKFHPDQSTAKTLFELIKQYHAHNFLIDYYLEIYMIAEAGNLDHDPLVDTAKQYLQRFVKAVYQHKSHQGLYHHSHFLLKRQADEIKRKDIWNSILWGIMQGQQAQPELRPEWVSVKHALPFINQPLANKPYVLVQQGEQLHFVPESQIEKLSPPGFENCVKRLLKIEVKQNLFLLETQSAGPTKPFDYPINIHQSITLPLNPEMHSVHINGNRYRLNAISKPQFANKIGYDLEGLFIGINWQGQSRRIHWQSPSQQQPGSWQGDQGFGHDNYGYYVDLSIGDIVQRFRWITPGRFLMGSPEDEAGRDDDEDLHEVTLTQGFWLADTTVTQDLWSEVMAKNPSKFKGRNHPVETVSFEDAQQFLIKLNVLCHGMTFELPTEAQWEYACRAGTQSAYNFGNKADASRMNFDENEDGTVTVKTYPCNAWGLYEMHGNVWEWCRDGWQARLSRQAQEDPFVEQGEYRVIRGGSWYGDGGGVRSAYRNYNEPDNRYDYLGLRLSLGHKSSSGGAKEPGAADLNPQPNTAEMDSILTKLKSKLFK